MARDPGSKWDPLPENDTQSRIRPTQIILHTAVDAPGPTDLQRYFAREDIRAESHFWVPLRGPAVQMMDTEVKANANRKADARAVSIETEDEGDPLHVPWNDHQLAELERIIRWAAATHGIPLEVVGAWDAPGIGYHSMWGFRDPINLIGAIDNPWSFFRGKTCPERLRIAQFWDVLMPRLRGIEGAEEDEMTPAQEAKLDEVLARLKASELDPPGPRWHIEARVKAIDEAVAKLAPAAGLTEAQVRAIVREELDRTRLGL